MTNSWKNMPKPCSSPWEPICWQTHGAMLQAALQHGGVWAITGKVWSRDYRIIANDPILHGPYEWKMTGSIDIGDREDLIPLLSPTTLLEEVQSLPRVICLSYTWGSYTPFTAPHPQLLASKEKKVNQYFEALSQIARPYYWGIESSGRGFMGSTFIRVQFICVRILAEKGLTVRSYKLMGLCWRRELAKNRLDVSWRVNYGIIFIRTEAGYSFLLNLWIQLRITRHVSDNAAFVILSRQVGCHKCP